MQATTSLIFGCMSLGGDWNNTALTQEDRKLAFAAIEASLHSGITCFDHADIYKFGKAEQVFGEFLQTANIQRETLNLQSKCGIQLPTEKLGTRYNLSKKWIIDSCENSLKRLKTEYLDTFLLHRPDPLLHPDEIADAFEHLFAAGKVRQFGVSNMASDQIAFINSSLNDNTRIRCNQLELNLYDTSWLDACVDFNQSFAATEKSAVYSTLLYCKQHNIEIQAWGSLAQGMLAKNDLPLPQKHCQSLLSSLAKLYETNINALQLAWLMNLPFDIHPVIGTSNPSRIAECQAADTLMLSREDWFALYAASRHNPLP